MLENRKARLEQEKILEAILFAAGDSVPVASLASALACDVPLVRNWLQRMKEGYEAEEAGIQLLEVDDSYQLCTNPKYYEYASQLSPEPARRTLTQTQLETLSIIAYKQPVTKPVIESIRGVNADHAVNKLMEYGLVAERGRLDGPGKPILFGTTAGFLRHFGLKTVDEFLKDHPQSNTAEQIMLSDEL